MTRAAKAKPSPEPAAALPPPPPATKPKASWRRRLATFTVRWSIVAAIWAAVAIGGVGVFYALQLPPIDDLEKATRRPGIVVLAADGSQLANYGELYGMPLTVAEMPKYLPQAVMAIEDRRFYSHFGIDVIGLARAAWVNYRSGRTVQGGSTLTQQVAKNVFLSPERSFKRKVQEVLLALWLEHKYSKDQILGIYLNRVYLGAGTYGVDAASWRYFGKSARQATLHESAVLAGLLKAPARYSPATDPNRSALRADTVLTAMTEAGYVTADQAEEARGDAILLAGSADKRPGRHFADWIADQIRDLVMIDRDLVIETTLDPKIQRVAEIETAKLLDGEGLAKNASEAAFVLLAKDGAVRAMVGGRDYGRSQFNRAATALRQPGSSFKLFVYLTALEAGMTSNSTILDAPIRIGSWEPENFDNRFHGMVTLTDAFAHSLNTPSVRLVQQLGPRQVGAMAHRLGINEPLTKTLGLGLGVSETTVVEMAGAYATVAANGQGVWPYGVKAIRDREGKLLYRGGIGPGRLLKPEIAQDMQHMLSEVVRIGSGKNANLGPTSPVMGKSGTSQDFRDAWFVGSTSGMTAAVWFGNDNNKPMLKVTGGDLPAKLFRAVMGDVLGIPPPPVAAVPPAKGTTTQAAASR